MICWTNLKTADQSCPTQSMLNKAEKKGLYFVSFNSQSVVEI